MVYFGLNNGQGLIVYVNGTEVGRDEDQYDILFEPGNGQFVIGKWFIDIDDYYASVAVDELTRWNRELTDLEIEDLHQMFS